MPNLYMWFCPSLHVYERTTVYLIGWVFSQPVHVAREPLCMFIGSGSALRITTVLSGGSRGLFMGYAPYAVRFVWISQVKVAHWSRPHQWRFRTEEPSRNRGLNGCDHALGMTVVSRQAPTQSGRKRHPDVDGSALATSSSRRAGSHAPA